MRKENRTVDLRATPLWRKNKELHSRKCLTVPDVERLVGAAVSRGSFTAIQIRYLRPFSSPSPLAQHSLLVSNKAEAILGWSPAAVTGLLLRHSPPTPQLKTLRLAASRPAPKNDDEDGGDNLLRESRVQRPPRTAASPWRSSKARWPVRSSVPSDRAGPDGAALAPRCGLAEIKPRWLQPSTAPHRQPTVCRGRT
jgi:hypothetical protein